MACYPRAKLTDEQKWSHKSLQSSLTHIQQSYQDDDLEMRLDTQEISSHFMYYKRKIYD